MRTRREVSAVLRYGLAVVAVLVAVLGTMLLGPTAIPAPLFFLAVILTAWFGGGGPGAVATGLATLALAYFVLPPIGSLRVDPPNRLPLLVFVLSALFVSWLSAVSRRALGRLQDARDELEARVRERTADLAERAALLDLTHDTVFARDMNDVITYWNRGATELYGWEPSEVVGRTTHAVLQTVFPAPLPEVKRTLLATGRWEGQLIHTRRDGTQVIVASRWALQRDQDGTPVAILDTNNDVTEQRRAEKALHDSEVKYRTIFDAVGVSIWEEDFSDVQAAIESLKAAGVRDFRAYTAAHPEFVRRAITMVKVSDVNAATVELFGATTKDELLTSLDRIFEPETEEVFAGELIAVAEGRTSFESETALRTLQGQRLTVLLTITFPPPPSRLDRVLVTMMDITERRQAEQALQKAEADLAHVARVTTLGELGASIAHEVNQPLAAIVADANACLNWLASASPDLDRLRETLAAMVKDGHRAADVVQRIRELATKSEPRKAPLEVEGVVREVLSLVRAEVRRHDVTLAVDVRPGLPPVLGDRVQLQQVILNLVMNGLDAMAGLRGQPRALLVRCERHQPGTIAVAVRDSGVGLDPDSAPRIFDAFYTTKPTGLGMGLCISRSIVEAHGGRLWATANDDHGATFQFTLPTTGE